MKYNTHSVVLPSLYFKCVFKNNNISKCASKEKKRLRNNALIAGGTSCCLCISMSASLDNPPKNVPFQLDFLLWKCESW